MSSRSFTFSTMVTTAAVVSVCACAWGQAPQPSATLPKVAGEASTKPPGKLKLLVWGTAKSEEEAQTLLAEYNKAKVDWEDYLDFPSGYPRVMDVTQFKDLLPKTHALVLGICPEKESKFAKKLFSALHPDFALIDSNDYASAKCPDPSKQRYWPNIKSIERKGKDLIGILFRAMIAHDYSLILVLRGEDGALLERKDESGLCDDAELWWDKDMKKLQFTGVCVTGLGTTLGTARVKKIFSIENDKIAVAEESEVLTTPTIHD